MQNHFVHEPEHYSRDLNILKHYTHDAALYLQKRTGKDFDTCLAWVKKKTHPGSDMGIVDPETLVLTKEKEGQREVGTLPLSHFLQDVEQNQRIISPTMAVYFHPKQKNSLLKDYIGINIKKRAVSKHQMFTAKTEGNTELATFKNNEQKSAKIKNNSLSGAQASAHTILRNKSAHSSLTSTCRSATSYGNANNEKFLMGNRHYWSPDVVKANIISVVRSTDYEAMKLAMDHHGIRHPTVDETMECIRYSTDLYWRNPQQIDDIHRLVERLSDEERSAFVYSGDLHHLAKYNDAVVREMLGKFATPAKDPVDDPDYWIGNMDSDLKVFVSLLGAPQLSTCSKGTVQNLKEENPQNYAILAGIAKKVIETLDEYELLIKGLWRVNTLPASVAHIRSSIRRSAVTSDTDSTIFTVQDWTKWYVGQIDFTETSNNIAHTMVYLASQSIIHVLAKLSAGLGVVPEMIHDLNMKNEFSFPVFCLTSMAKHYFAYVSACEGNVYSELDTVVKGVQLKDSNCPPHVMDQFKKTLNWTMDHVMSGEGVPVQELYHRIAVIENGIRQSIVKGGSTYLTSGSIKDAESYANPASSNYMYYGLWQEVFAPKYGDAPEPPYAAIKVMINKKNQTAVREWLNDLKDQELAERFRRYLQRTKRTGVTSMLLPRGVVEVTGLPEEIIQAIDIRGLTMATVRPFYILLESLGIFLMNDNNTKLVSDYVDVTPGHSQMLSPAQTETAI